jgi:hypothetical protein
MLTIIKLLPTLIRKLTHLLLRMGFSERGLARQNSGGAFASRVEALFCLDFSLVRFFSSKEKK